MEQARMFLAIALSFLVFFLWNTFFMEKETPEKTDQRVGQKLDQKRDVTQNANIETTVRETRDVDKKTGRVVSEQAEKATTLKSTIPKRKARTFSVDTPLYAVKISEERAAFKSFVLKNYREHNNPDSPLKEMISEENEIGTYIVDFEGNEIPGLSSALFKCEGAWERTDVTNKPEELVFSWRSKEGIEVEKTYKFYPDSYIIDFEVSVKNRAEYPLQNNITVSLFKNMENSKSGQYGFTDRKSVV